VKYVEGGRRDSVVGIANPFGLQSRGLNPVGGREFAPSPRPTIGPTQPPVKWVPGLS
jgi:hypothetical protein